LNPLDARRLGDRSDLTAAVCVVGAGIAGVTVATRLADAGIDVVLLEAGGVSPDPATQSLYDLRSVEYPVRENFMSRARYLGGSCNLWAGRSMRLSPGDLHAHGTSSEWPIPYEELSRYYPGAGDVLDLPRPAAFDPDTHSDRFGSAERSLLAAGLAPVVALWARSPKRVGGTRPDWLRRRNLRLVLHANVTRLNLQDGSDRHLATVEARALDGPTIQVRADRFVLACGGIENARLLLLPASGSDVGLGNRSDMAGRFFMDHPRAIHGSVRLRGGARLPLLEGRPLRDGKVQIGLGLPESVRRAEGLLNHYATLEATRSEYVAQGYESAIRTAKTLLRRGHAGGRMPGRTGPARIPDLVYLLTPKELLPHPVYRALVAARDRFRGGSRSPNRTVVYFCEQPPDPESRVSLGHDRDVLGLPCVELAWRVGADVVRSLERLQEHLSNAFEKSGVGTLTAGVGEPRFTDASHHMGTTRMSHHPSRGVVDADSRVHGIDNLFVAGSSVFPCAGHANPTLTLVALALRLAEHLGGGRA
jgi:choline dehydrogenase-like flavoprotein